MTSSRFAARRRAVAAGAIGCALTVAAPAFGATCESWNRDLEMRCLIAGEPASEPATVSVRNSSAQTVYFHYEEWQSLCGLPGESRGGWVAQLAPGEEVHISVGPNSVPLLAPETMCNELFVFGCIQPNIGLDIPVQTIDCADFLEARFK